MLLPADSHRYHNMGSSSICKVRMGYGNHCDCVFLCPRTLGIWFSHIVCRTASYYNYSGQCSPYLFNLPMVCNHDLSWSLYVWLIHHIRAIFICKRSALPGLSNISTTIAIPPWHVHVTKSPTSSLCLGGFSKKSFTLSINSTHVIIWDLFCGVFF